MINNKYLALLVLFTLVLSMLPLVSAENTATDIYVSTSGNDKNSGLTIDQPKKTITKGIKAVKNGGTVHVTSGTYKENIEIKKEIQLIGEDPGNTIIDGKHKDICIYIHDTGAVVIKGFTITNGESLYGGGGICVNDAFLTVQRCIIQNNKAKKDWLALGAKRDGGGIRSLGGKLVVENSTIQNNDAAGDGGGIIIIYSPTVIRNSIIQFNDAGKDGGGIFIYYADMTVENTKIQYNHATKGGGIRTVHGSLNIINTLIQHNNANRRGGGIDSKKSFLDSINSHVINNIAPNYPDIY